MDSLKTWAERVAKVIIIIYLLSFALAVPSNFINMPGHKAYMGFTTTILYPIHSVGSKLFLPAAIVLLSIFLWKKFGGKREPAEVVSGNSDHTLNRAFKMSIIIAVLALIPILLVVILMGIGG